MRRGKPLGSAYTLRDPIGHGSTGQLWRADAKSGGAPVAVKILRPELTADQELLTRFVRERNILISLRHPNLVSVRDVVVEGETYAIVMDLVQGSDLRRHLASRGPLPWTEAAALIAQVLDGLTAVHAAGIVHRDLKPENVLLDLTDPGRPRARLSDFGIARLAAAPATLTGVVGTPEYMAPELTGSDPETPAADLYAAGVVLYELVAGETPFVDDDPVAVLRRQLEDEPGRPEAMPDALWELVSALLAKEPGRRPGPAEAVAERLRVLVASAAGGMAPPGQPLDGAGGAGRTPPVAPAEPTPAAVIVVAPVPGVVATQPPARESDVDAGLAAPPRAAGRGRRRTRRAVAAGALLVAAAVATAVTVPRALRTASGPAATTPVRQGFPEVVRPDGLLVDRAWQLSSSGPATLHSRLRIANPTSAPVTAMVDEVVPKSVAVSAGLISFSPPPDEVVAADPVVRYDVRGLAPGHSVELDYDVPVRTTGAPASWLRTRATDQVTAEANYLAQMRAAELVSLQVAPATVRVAPGQAFQLTAQATRGDGSPAGAGDLAAIDWSSSDPAVVGVDGGRLTANAPGTAVVTARIGALQAAVAVTVAVAATTATATAPPTAVPSRAPTPRAGPVPRPRPTPTPQGTARPGPPVPLDGGRWDTSFEHGLDGWGPLDPTVVSLTLIPDAAAARDGTYFAVASASQAYNAEVLRKIPVDGTVGRTYTFSIWVRSDAAAPFMGRIVLAAIGGASSEMSDAGFTAGAPWTQLTVSLTVAKPAETTLQLGLQLDTPASVASLAMDLETVTVSG